MREHLPPPDQFIGKPMPHNPRFEIVEHIKSGNNGHVFRAHSETTDHDWACKLVPVENLPSDPDTQSLWLEEAKKSNRLTHTAVVPCEDVVHWRDDEADRDYVWFVYHFVPGKSLRDYVRAHRGEISLAFIESFLATMLEVLFELQERNIAHGDLHSGNVIVAEPSRYDIEPRVSFRVIDFGVRRITGGTGDADDFLGVARMLKDLLEAVDYQGLGARDKYAYEVLRQKYLARHLIETDPLVDPLQQNPRAMYRDLRQLGSDYEEKRAQREATRMTTPFDYPNCEQMGNAHLLLDSLYSNRFLGLPAIEARNNLVLTGPRGCGKTTVFRALSLRHRIQVQKDAPDSVAYVGIYYRCDDIYFAFPRYRHIDRQEAVDVPMHFVVATLLIELLEVIEAWGRRQFADEFRKREETVARGLWECLGLHQPPEPNALQFETLVAKLRKERTRAADKFRVRHDPKQTFGRYFGPEKLIAACRLLRDELAFLGQRPIYVLVDDYSEPKISVDLQENLNRLFLHRTDACFFKLSTESPVSFVTRDMDGKVFVETREYTLLNLGIQYIKHGGLETLAFLDDLFARRFGEVQDYPVKTLEMLIGNEPRIENEIARRLRTSPPPKPINYGTQTLAAMCSGDIHYMIRLVERMVNDAGGADGLRARDRTPKIGFDEQHETIRAAAGDFLASVRMLPKYGPRLADIIAAFGSVARSLLMYRNSKNEVGNPPHQASRIEPYESYELTGEAAEIYKALLRYSIFLEDPRGKSRRGHVVPRLYLRRYLIPQFNLTFSLRDSVEVEPEGLVELLTNPKRFEQQRRLRERSDEHTGDLFDD